MTELDPLANGFAEARVIVADTDVVSFPFKRDNRGELYRPHLERHRPAVSAQTLGELRHWPVYRGWGERRRRQLDAFIAHYLVIYPNADICRIWGELTARASLAGRPLPSADAWHAATAVYLGVPLVTHNPRNYGGAVGLIVITERM